MKKNIKTDKFKTTALLAVIFTLLHLFACTHQGVHQPVSKAEAQSLDEAGLRDNASLYENEDVSSLITMYLTVRRGNEEDNTDHSWEEINLYSAYYYNDLGIERYCVEALLQVGDEEGPSAGELGYGRQTPNAVVQIRGNASSEAPQKSYKISIKSNAGSSRNQTTISLNKYPSDGLRFRSKLCYDLAKQIPGMITLRTQFVHLYVKDETGETPDTEFYDYGLYTQVEKINKAFLENHGMDRNGNLYEAIDFVFARYANALMQETDPGFNKSAFEAVLESQGDNDHSKLLAMLDDLSDESVPINEIFEKYFDADNYFTWLAFQILTDNTDAKNSNFFLYSPSNGLKWYFITYGANNIWTRAERAWRKGDNADTEYSQGFDYGVANYWENILHRRVLMQSEYREMLDDKIEMVSDYLSNDVIDSLVLAYDNAVRKLVYSMPDAAHARLTNDAYDMIAYSLQDEMEEADSLYELSLQKPAPFRLEVPRRVAGGLTFAWENAFSFSGMNIVYRLEIARDYSFNELVYLAEDITDTSVFVELTQQGQYFARVTATDEDGNFRYSMDRYDDKYKQAHYGVKCFYIQADGEVISDEYYPEQIK